MFSYLPTRNLKCSDISLSNLDVFDGGTNLLDDAAEFVPKDVALLHLDNGAMEQM